MKNFSHQSQELSDNEVNNITRYLNHSSTVARSQYVIDKPETVINTKTLIKTHVFKIKPNEFKQHLSIPDPEESSSSLESEESISYDGPTDKMVPEYRETFQGPELDYLYFSNLLASTWPPHANCIVPTARKIMKDIISKDPKSGKYYNCTKKSPEFKHGIRYGSIAYKLNQEYRSWRIACSGRC